MLLINFCNFHRVQDVFVWQLKVEPLIRNIETGRVVWSIKYDKDGHGERYFSSESQIVSSINLRGKENDQLVTILKVKYIESLHIKSKICLKITKLSVLSMSEEDDMIFCYSCES